MTITTTITVSHEELHSLGLKDEDFRDLGYNLRQSTTQGKTYEKISWQTGIDIKEL